MTKSKQQIRETETNELSEEALNAVTGGIIAVLQPKLCDGSVRPAATPTQNALIALL